MRFQYRVSENGNLLNFEFKQSRCQGESAFGVRAGTLGPDST